MTLVRRFRRPGRVLALAGLVSVPACAPPPRFHPATPTPQPSPAPSPIPATSRQLIVVTAANWDTIPAVLIRFERASDTGAWRIVDPAVPVVLGKGLGWGAGLNDVRDESGPVKHEGDGRSPAGVFRFGEAFGFGPADTIGRLHVSYVQLTPATDCVDDPASPQYNTLAERPPPNAPPAAWKSAEHMRAIDPDYRYGIVIDHNSNPRTPGRGSCIFMHIWEGPTTPTAGCTALDPLRLADILRWLDASADPVLVQLPRATYESHRAPWALPQLP